MVEEKNLETILKTRNQLNKQFNEKLIKTMVIMFIDIAIPTKIIDDDSGFVEMSLSREHNGLIFPIIEEYGGKVVNVNAGKRLVSFDSTEQAALAAIKIQEVFEDKNLNTSDSDNNISVVISINYGDVLEETDNLFGNAVNVAAQMAGDIDESAILVSQDFYSQIKNLKNILVRYFRTIRLEGKEYPVELYKVIH